MASQTSDRSSAFLRSEEVSRQDLGGGIVRQILGRGPDLMLVRVAFEKGSVGDVHSHPHSQATYVESGRFEVFIDGVKRILEPGDSFFVAPELDHGAVCLEAGVLIDSFSPAREDFLQVGDPL